MRTMCSQEIFTKKGRQQQIFDLDLKGAWPYSQVIFAPIAQNFMLYYCGLIYMLSILCVRLTIKVKVGIPESFKVGWYSPPPKKKTGSSHLKNIRDFLDCDFCSFVCIEHQQYQVTFISYKTAHKLFPVDPTRGDADWR